MGVGYSVHAEIRYIHTTFMHIHTIHVCAYACMVVCMVVCRVWIDSPGCMGIGSILYMCEVAATVG